MLYLEFLHRLHQLLLPRSYLEIGVRHGRSLALASAPAIGIDPRPEVTSELGPSARVMPTTSDAFFATGDGMDLLPERSIDLAFIDGMHLFEYAFRDFVNVERYCGPGSVIVLDDVLPRTPLEASRRRRTKAWTGDVWKVMPVLAEQRPDLVLFQVAVRPTGVLVVLCPDPAASRGRQHGEQELRRLRRTPGPERSVVDRSNAVDPAQLLAAPFWEVIREARAGLTPPDDLRRAVRAWQPVPLTPEQVAASKGSARGDDRLPGPIHRLSSGLSRRMRAASRRM